MRFTETSLPGAYLVDLTPANDERGFFARAYSPQNFHAQGLKIPPLDQASISFNARRATLRGMHFQVAPLVEHKLVRCTAGQIFDVIVDLRPESPGYQRWYGVELSATNRRALYIPPGLAHGFLTLCDASEVYYMISNTFSAEHARGVRWNDPAFSIHWPFEPEVMAARDAAYPLWSTRT